MKKYQPSGYQIINIDVSDKTSDEEFTPTTEDEKILWEILNEQTINNNITKPLLIHIKGMGFDVAGFGIFEDFSSVSITSSNVRYTIVISDDKLIVSEYEL